MKAILFCSVLTGWAAFISAGGGQTGSQTLVAGVDYVQGQVILTFSEAHMPSPSQVVLEPPSFGIPAIDDFIRSHKGVTLVKLVPSYGELSSEAGKRLERTFLLVYNETTDAQMVATVIYRTS